MGKGEIAHNEQFLLFPQCFLPCKRNFCHFRQIQNCRLQPLSVWKSLKFVVWEGVKKACFPGASKGVIVWEWVNLLSYRVSFFGPTLPTPALALFSLCHAEPSPIAQSTAYRTLEQEVPVLIPGSANTLSGD